MLIAATVAAAVLAAYALRRGAVHRVELLYWQGRCAAWDGPVIAPPAAYAPVGRPGCYLSLRSAMTADGWRPGPRFHDTFGTEPVVFLHDRTSPAGHRRILCVDFRPNVDHLQWCSVDCFVLTPATLVSAPAATFGVAAWVGGFQTNVRWDRLRPATADPVDASHFVFRYEEVRCKVPSDDDPFGADVQGKRPDQLVVVTHTLDGWLGDNGTVDVRERADDPASTPGTGQ